MEFDPDEPMPMPGYRLSKFEIYNWGTFDGQVYSVQPRGQTTLLIGENGSGKSTLVDALLTLLVRPQTRNYNVAAGAQRTNATSGLTFAALTIAWLATMADLRLSIIEPATGITVPSWLVSKTLRRRLASPFAKCSISITTTTSKKSTPTPIANAASFKTSATWLRPAAWLSNSEHAASKPPTATKNTSAGCRKRPAFERRRWTSSTKPWP